MNTMWSDCVQSIDTLHLSRALRFSDMFRKRYTQAFGINDGCGILEIGCGPGSLAQALRRWYPGSTVTGIDRDGNFIRHARQLAPDCRFLEGDATTLEFADGSFDVTISNTVAEHVEPSKFFGEQRRVLRPGGVCLMLSARRGVHQEAPCIAEQSEFETDIWNRVEARCRELDRENGVCRYPMSEAEYPACMEKYGFREVSTQYVTINLTPDNPDYSRETALAMFEANHKGSLDGVDALAYIAPDLVTADERQELKRLIDVKYARRIELYDAGIKQWDANVSLTMILRGIK